MYHIHKQGYSLKNGKLVKAYNIEMNKNNKGYNIVGYNNNKIVNKHVRYIKSKTNKRKPLKNKTKKEIIIVFV